MSTKNPSQVLNVSIHEVLQQITIQVRIEAPELRITMKPRTRDTDTDTTWTSVLAEVIETLKSSDKKIMIGPEQRKMKDRSEAARKQLFPPGADLTKTSGGLPIQTSFPAHIDLPEPTPRTPEAQERLRKRAKEEMMAFGHLDPFVITKTATMYDRIVHTATQEIRDDEWGVITTSEYVEIDDVLYDPE